MSRFNSHVKSDRIKWVVVFVSLLLVAVLLCGMMTSWFSDFNPYCWFGHEYDEATKVCNKCGLEEQQVEEPEEEEPVASRYNFATVALGGNGGIALMSTTSMITFDGQIVRFQYAHMDEVQEFCQNSAWIYVASLEYPIDSEGRAQFNALQLAQSGTLKYNTEYTVSYGMMFFRPGESGLPSGEDQGVAGKFMIQTQSELPPAPTKTGYTFAGWYKDAELTQPYTDDKVVGNITLYAKFVANTYTIKFHANGGAGSMADLSMTYDEAKYLPANTFTRARYTFIGWTNSITGKPDGWGRWEDKARVNNITATQGGVINLYAEWELNSYTVSFVVEGQTASTVDVIIDEAAPLPEAPSKEGYNFVGWFLPNGTQYTNQGITADTVLTAKFEIIRCVVTFMVDGKVYAYYECDWGTNLNELLNDNVNPALYTTEDEHGPNF